MIGIYCIENKVNHKCYIGQSIDIECRWRQHKNNYLVLDLPLYLDMRKYGLESFSFNIVCECTKDDLTTYEFATMQRYILNGYTLYNIITPISTSIKITEDVIMNIISLLKECEMSHSDIAVDCGVSVEVVDGINTGRLYRLPYIDYPIVDYKLLSEDHLRILKTCPISGN